MSGLSGLGSAGLRVIRTTAAALVDMQLDVYRATILEQFPRDMMRLRVEQATVHRRPGVEAAFRYLNHQAPKREGWDWTGIAPGNPLLAEIFGKYLEKPKEK